MSELQGVLTVNKTLRCVLNPESGEAIKDYLSGEIHATLEPLPHKPVKYEGSYEIDPLKTMQVLSTKDKVMTEDMTVLGIYYYEVTNETGGNTVTIGRD